VVVAKILAPNRISKETTYITAGDSDVYSLVFEPFTDGTNAGEILKLNKLETAYGQGGVSHEAFVKAKNGIIYLSNEPTGKSVPLGVITATG